MQMRGGGYAKGPRAGDQYLTVSAAGLPGLDAAFRLVVRDGAAWMNAGGGWERVELPQEARGQLQASHAAGVFEELARYVRDVRVGSTVVDGGPATTIAGEVDAAGLVKGLARMSAFAGVIGSDMPGIDQVEEVLGDTSVVLVVSDRTRLVRAAMLRFSIRDGEQRAEIEVSYRLTSVNEPVAIPKPPDAA